MTATTGLPSLRTRVVQTQGALALAVVGVLVTLLVVTLHVQIHAQTDALLLRMAQQDALDIRHEESEGVHMHETPVPLPALPAQVAERIGLVIDADCRVLAVAALDESVVPPPEVCAMALDGQPQMVNASGLSADELRLGVAVTTLRDGRMLRVFSGVRHADIDASTWHAIQLAVPASLVALLLLVGGSLALAGWMTRDLRGLAEACEALDATQLSESSVAALTRHGGVRSHETATLARTIADLVRRVSDTLQQRERFLAEAAHDLRTPLTSLMGDIEVTLRKPRTAEAYREALERAQGDVERLSDLAEHLLQAAAAQQAVLQLECVELHTLVVQRVQIAALDRAGIQVELQISPDLRVWADERATARVLDNLLANVVQHARATSVKLIARAERSGIELVLSDNGRGLPPEVQRSLFEPFSRPVGADESGHGLGLYLCRALMQRQGGSLEPMPAEREDTRTGMELGVAWRLQWSRPPAGNGSVPGSARVV